MTIKRYDCDTQYGMGVMEESLQGDYVKREDVLEWLRTSIRKEYIYEIPRLLIEELQ